MSASDIEESIFLSGVVASDSQASANDQARAIGHALASRTGALKQQAQVAILATAGVVGWMSRGSVVVVMATSNDGASRPLWGPSSRSIKLSPQAYITLTSSSGMTHCSECVYSNAPVFPSGGYAGYIYWPDQFIGIATIPEDGVYSLSNFTGTAIVVY